jgi:hypothetical protein
MRLSTLSKDFKIEAFAHSPIANIITTDEIPITIHKTDKLERNLFAKIEEIHCFMRIKIFINNLRKNKNYPTIFPSRI